MVKQREGGGGGGGGVSLGAFARARVGGRRLRSRYMEEEDVPLWLTGWAGSSMGLRRQMGHRSDEN